MRDTSGRFESPYWFVLDVKGVLGLSVAKLDGIEAGVAAALVFVG